MLEKTLNAKLRALLSPHGLYCRIETGATCPGFPDIVFINKRGVVHFIELKVGKNKLRPVQIAFDNQVSYCKGNVWLLRWDRDFYILSNKQEGNLTSDKLANLIEILL